MNRANLLIYGLCLTLVLTVNGCTKKTAEEKGKEIAEKKIDLVKGVGEGLKSKGESAGESIGEGLSKTVKGIAQGVDKAMAPDIRLSPDLSATGLKITKTDKLNREKKDKKKKVIYEKGISLYAITDKELNMPLLLKAFNKTGQEIARSSSKAILKSNDAGYIDFVLDERFQIADASYFTLEKGEAESNKKAK